MRVPSPSRGQAAFAGVFATTFLVMFAVGATLPVLPRFVKGPLDAGNIAVGVAVGVYSVTGLAGRPWAGRIADASGRRLVVVGGALVAAAGGLLMTVPAGLPGLIVARLMFGLGEGAVFTAGSAWIADIAPHERRARLVGIYGLAIWTGLSTGPPAGEWLYRAAGFDAVWILAGAAPLLGAALAMRVRSGGPPAAAQKAEARGPLIARESVRPGLALAMVSAGFASVLSFVVLHLEERGIGHGAEAFTALAATVVATRLLAGGLPDRLGPTRVAPWVAAAEVIGLGMLALAQTVFVAIAGAIVIGAAFSLLYPCMSLVVMDLVPEQRRGAAFGTLTAFFDLGVGVGAPLAGAAAALGGYAAAFGFGSACAFGALLISLTLPQTRSAGEGRPAWSPAS